MANTKVRKPKLVKTKYNTRVPCICRIRSAKMIYKGRVIGIISEESNDAGEFDWVIKMDWKEWEKDPIQVAGIDMDLRLDEYIRTYIPAFVEERTMPDTRENLKEELDEVGLLYNDRYEYMCRTHGLCGCNNITVERFEDKIVSPYAK